ncbi:hypothetical protein PVAND_016646 [Polypedilum vanderplanki]|uniref:Uncharacterized protein n=1 Tax=Polypedilum vanderplanki TaxID=319348 RepID=A0A9J6BGX7_POLVA|nr:hypothetical protein PVAND_016646 [Polypedilum vanderplanki]
MLILKLITIQILSFMYLNAEESDQQRETFPQIKLSSNKTNNRNSNSISGFRTNLILNQKSQAISQAMADIIDEFFIRQQILFNVTIIKPISKDLQEIIDNTLMKIKEIQPFYVKFLTLNESKI